MRVSKNPTSSYQDLPPSKSSYDTTFLWTEKGMLDTVMGILSTHTYVDGELEVKMTPFRGSVSKVYHSEPATVTWYSTKMWREKTPTSDEVFSVLS
jgi:hypothetical protein